MTSFVCDTPIYDALVGELLIDPERVAREVDEDVIRYYVDHPPRT